jgi:hypothetical protein
MIARVVRLSALVALIAAEASAQDRRLVTRLDSSTASVVSRIVDSVRAAGLPTEPLVGVALEGASRRAPNDKIVRAVREYASALGVARQTLGESAASDEIVSAAGVLVVGVQAGVVGEYRMARPTGSLTVPLVVLADLIARGVPADTASSAIGLALRNGARDDQLTEMRRRIERDILAGARPATATTIRTQDLPGVQTPRRLIRPPPRPGFRRP